ncbi:MAG TPA: TonB-dependent receptor plug domain-containing protein, partial [Atribacterota bacterium]|nr:TonB-dependent receptor plug domain-containing protein [Atribacterota bacterium]
MFQKFNSIITIFLIIFIINISLGNQLFAAGQQEPLFSLPEVVVIASKYPQELLESVASVKIISKEEILSSQSQNLAGIISNIAGIEVTDYGSPGDIKSLSIRGSSPEQVLVMIDGQVVNDQQTGKIDLGIIPTSIIEKIEIYRGPASALYGANALGGVINIVTKKGNGEKNLATGLYCGSNQTQKYQISYQNRGAEWNYFFTGEYYQTQGERENSQLDRISLFGKISKELDQYTNLDLTIRYIDYQRGIPGPAYYPSPLAQQEDRNFNLNLQWQKKEEDKDINVIAWYDFKTLSYDDPDEWEYSGASLNKNHTLGISFDCTNYDFNWSNLGEQDGTNILTWGGELK